MFHEFELILWSCHATLETFRQTEDKSEQFDDLSTTDEIFEKVQTHLLHTAFFIKESLMSDRSKCSDLSAYKALLSSTFTDFAS